MGKVCAVRCAIETFPLKIKSSGTVQRKMKTVRCVHKTYLTSVAQRQWHIDGLLCNPSVAPNSPPKFPCRILLPPSYLRLNLSTQQQGTKVGKTFLALNRQLLVDCSPQTLGGRLGSNPSISTSFWIYSRTCPKHQHSSGCFPKPCSSVTGQARSSDHSRQCHHQLPRSPTTRSSDLSRHRHRQHTPC